MLDEIISGGQTGVDRAALDAAMEAGIRCGGWCPKGRWAEDGRIDDRYPLKETKTSDPSERTRLNVIESDGTLILEAAASSAGTALTQSTAADLGLPNLVIPSIEEGSVRHVRDWIETNRISRLNIAGPRASESSGVYARARAFVVALVHLP